MILTILFGVLIIILAGFTQGVTSFGFALISVPILSNFIPLHVVVPIVVILSIFSNVAILLETRKYIELRKIWILIISSLIAAPFGVYILKIVDANSLKLFIGVLIIFFSLSLLKGISFSIRNEKIALIPVGISSGLLNGSISFSGPPVALFMNNQGVNKQVFRANITAYAFILNFITIASYYYTGLINIEVIKYSIWFIPAMFFGVYIGMKTLRFVSEKLFKKITLYLLILSGLWTIFTVLL